MSVAAPLEARWIGECMGSWMQHEKGDISARMWLGGSSGSRDQHRSGGTIFPMRLCWLGVSGLQTQCRACPAPPHWRPRLSLYPGRSKFRSIPVPRHDTLLVGKRIGALFRLFVSSCANLARVETSQDPFTERILRSRPGGCLRGTTDRG
jgi:hypothetical protein